MSVLNHFVKLSSFIGNSLKTNRIAFDLKDYLERVDWIGRMVRDDKRGSTEAHTQGIYSKAIIPSPLKTNDVLEFSLPCKALQIFCLTVQILSLPEHIDTSIS